MVVLAGAALIMPLTACSFRVTANPKATEKPALVWYYYNPLTTLQKDSETKDIKTSPQKMDTSKNVVISGTGVANAGMRSSKMTAELYGECVGVDDGWVFTNGYGYAHLDKTAEDSPPIKDGKADFGAGAIMQFTSAELRNYVKTGVDCNLTGIKGQPLTGKRKAVRLRVHADVTTVGGVTTQGDLVLTP